MYFRLILIIVLLIICTHLLADKKSDDAEKHITEQDMLKIEKFKAESGFEGSVQTIDDKRLFCKLEGTFPLPEPVNKEIFESNCQMISNFIKSIYEVKATHSELEDSVSWNLKISQPVASFNQLYALNYNQYFNDFPLSLQKYPVSIAVIDPYEIDCKLSIYYHIKDKKYSVINGLFPEGILLRKPRFSKQQALDILRAEVNKPEYLQKRGLSNSHTQPSLQPEFGSYYLSVLPVKDNKTHTFSYYYLLFVKFEGDFQYYIVDGITGEIEVVPKID